MSKLLKLSKIEQIKRDLSRKYIFVVDDEKFLDNKTFYIIQKNFPGSRDIVI